MFVCTNNGYTNVEVMKEYYEYLQRWMVVLQRIKFLVLMDGARQHLASEALTGLKQHKNMAMRFVSHTSHKLQPLGINVFSSFQKNV